ncbi:hypothetical protein F5Y10DRAFT_199164 [Nemania abortiva]|nr:hypothetical protein F5Y10DRAFT_199164 [Nemania abortiva]
MEKLGIALAEFRQLHKLTPATKALSDLTNVSPEQWVAILNETATYFHSFMDATTQQYLTLTNTPAEVIVKLLEAAKEAAEEAAKPKLTLWEWAVANPPQALFGVALWLLLLYSVCEFYRIFTLAYQFFFFILALPSITVNVVLDLFWRGHLVQNPLLRIIVQIVSSFFTGLMNTLSRFYDEVLGDTVEELEPRDGDGENNRRRRHPRTLVDEFEVWAPRVWRALPILLLLLLVLGVRRLSLVDWDAIPTSAQPDKLIGHYEVLWRSSDVDIIRQAEAAYPRPLAYRVLSDGTYTRFDPRE